MNFVDDDLQADEVLFDEDGGGSATPASSSSSSSSSSAAPLDAAATRRRRLDSDSDDSDSDDSDDSGVTRQPRAAEAASDSDSDAAPRRKGGGSDSDDDGDASPPRRESNLEPQKQQPHQQQRLQSKPPGFKGGLISGADFAKEQALAKSRNQPSSSSSSKAPGVVHRDRDGNVIDFQKTKKARETAKKREEYLWGTGKKQREEMLKNFEHIQKISEAPFSQFADDKDGMRDEALRNRVRVEDPMAKFEGGGDQDGGSGSSNSGGDPGKAKKIYRGPPAPMNRFGILPGYRWDGVNRGNGFEAKVVESLHKNKRKR
jgi:pre-mRNA-splicing factor CWC26